MPIKKSKDGIAAYVDPKTGHVYEAKENGRIDFSKISGSFPLPDLVAIQTESFKWFKEKGLDEAMKEVFPISNYAGTVFIDYLNSHFEEPQYGPLDCKKNGLDYSSKLKVNLALRLPDGSIKEVNEVFMGEVPMMTESGTFIVNGAERVIVSQIVRSPGAYFQKTLEKNNVYIYNGEIIPSRGTWLQFESDAKGVLWVRIDRQRKMPAVVLFKALGFSEKTIYDLFGKGDSILATIEKDKDNRTADDALIDIFRSLKPGEPITREGVANFLRQKFFDEKRYDLGKAGRFKYTRKLGIYDRLPGRILAENLVNSDGEILFEKGHKLTKEEVVGLMNDEVFQKGAHTKDLSNKESDRIDPGHARVNVIKVHAFDKPDGEVISIVGTDMNLFGLQRIAISDMVACFNYFMNIQYGIGALDDIDHLGNRRVRCVGELLQNQVRIGLSKMEKTVQQKMSITDVESAKPKELINIRPLTSSIREFYSGNQLSSFMDQTNPLSGLTNKRRISALGPGGITRDRASMEVRDVHFTHYGRICPIETPEGQNIGLINNLSTYAKVDELGFIRTPYRHVLHQNGKTYVSEQTEYLSADDERGYYIAEANIRLGEDELVGDNKVKEILDKEVVCRHDGENEVADASLIDYVDVSPKQIVSIAAACIPFLENDDTTRALMGANMQRQALPLLRPSLPYVGTGLEKYIAKDSGMAVIAKGDGVVTYTDSGTIKVGTGKDQYTYTLQKFDRSNQGTCINQNPIVKVGDTIRAGQVIADGPAMKSGELALGQNVLVAYMTWNGYNYEDAIIMSERLVKEDVYTSIHIERYDIECRETKLGNEEITRDIPNVSEEAKAFLDERGIIIQGAEVKEGDILVGKITPKGQTEPTPEEKLLMAIFAEKTKDGKDSSMRVPHGGAGIVHSVHVHSRKNKDPLPPGVIMSVSVYIVQKRKISEGDKMSGRHGNKGVISKILPIQDMPFLPDGTPIDIMLSPMGVPSRMNIGQILEIHLGLACHKLGIKVATPVFDGISNDEIYDLMKQAGISEDGKTVLYDGRTGERFDERISVGIMYMIKLVHMVDDKLHARATGPYTLVTQQPLGGKAQNGGQRFGEMEVWALEAYGAAHTLQEMMTIKSDDRVGRRKAYEAIIKRHDLPEPGMPEAFKVFTKEIRGLGLNVKLYDQEGEIIDMDTLAKQAMIAERKVNSAIRNLTSPKEEEAPDTIEVEVPVDEEAVLEEGLSVNSKLPSEAE